MLYLVGTPIGNMGDISSRAVEILSSVDYIACEDTRVTGILLKNLGIEEHKLISYHEHNKASKGQELVDLLKQGFNATPVRTWLSCALSRMWSLLWCRVPLRP